MRSSRGRPHVGRSRRPGDPSTTSRPPGSAYYDKISKFHMAPLWEVLKGLVTPEPKTQMRAGAVEIRRRQEADAGSRRRDHRRGSRAPRARARKSRRARQVAHHQFAVRRHPADHAGRDRRRAPARRLRHPLRAGRRRRLYRGRRREVGDAARRLHHHRQLGAARSRQSRQAAGDVARRARPADRQPLRDLVRHASRREDAEDQSRGRRLVRPLRLRRAAGRRAGAPQPHAR